MNDGDLSLNSATGSTSVYAKITYLAGICGDAIAGHITDTGCVNNGNITVDGAEITATAEKTDKYYGASASYTLRILKAPSQEWVDLGTINLENEVLCDYLNQANAQYTDTNDDEITVMNKYSGSNYSYIERKDCPAPVHITWTDAASNSTVITIYEDQALTKKVWSQNASAQWYWI